MGRPEDDGRSEAEPAKPVVRILVIDDDPLDCDLVRARIRRLDSLPSEVDTVHTFGEALSRMRRNSHDLYLVDYNLGEDNGLDLIRQAKAAGCRGAVIMLTGVAEGHIDQSALGSGASDYLVKSDLSPRDLLRSIRYALERQRVLSRLEDRESAWRVALQAADGLVVVDDDDTVLFANPAAEALLGNRPGTTVRGRFPFPLPPDETLSFSMSAGNDGPCEVEARVVRIDWSGKAARLASLRNITERRQLESQLWQTEKLAVVGRLAGGIAHDFNNLMMGIQGNVELARAESELAPHVRSYLDEIRQCVRRAAELTQRLLTFSRNDEVELRVFDLQSRVRHLESVLRRLVHEGIRLRFEPADDKLHVKADPLQVDQVLMNLVANARDAVGGQGTITVKTRIEAVGERRTETITGSVLDAGTYAVVMVSDDGPGMDSETLRQIFQPFFTTKSVGEGTGLGLSTVYGIATRLGGAVWPQSSLGRGTRISVYLPLLDSSQHTGEWWSEPAIETIDDDPVGKETVLIVEDEPVILRVLRTRLIAAGYDVLTAEDGRAALDVAHEAGGRIDLVLTDIVMPEMDGFELTSRLRREHPALGVLFMTGYGDEVLAEHNLSKDGFDYLSKPFRLTDVMHAIRQKLDERRGTVTMSRSGSTASLGPGDGGPNVRGD